MFDEQVGLCVRTQPPISNRSNEPHAAQPVSQKCVLKHSTTCLGGGVGLGQNKRVNPNLKSL